MSKEPHIVDLPRIMDPRGNLSVIESEDLLPFKIARAYWIYDVPGGMFRNGVPHTAGVYCGAIG